MGNKSIKGSIEIVFEKQGNLFKAGEHVMGVVNTSL
jgi:hypothetical protein